MEELPFVIEKVVIDWMYSYANSPSLKILLSEPNTRHHFKDAIYTHKSRIFYAELPSGLVDFFEWHKPDNGFAGRDFHILAKEFGQSDEEAVPRILKGPWQVGTPTTINLGLGDVVEVSVWDPPTKCGKRWPNGRRLSGVSYFIRRDVANRLCDEYNLRAHFLLDRKNYGVLHPDQGCTAAHKKRFSYLCEICSDGHEVNLGMGDLR